MDPTFFTELAREIFINSAAQKILSPSYESKKSSPQAERPTRKTQSPLQAFFATYSKDDLGKNQAPPSKTPQPQKQNTPPPQPRQRFDFQAQYREIDKQRAMRHDHGLER